MLGVELSQDLLKIIKDVALSMSAAYLGSLAGSHVERRVSPNSSGMQGKALGAAVGMGVQTVYKQLMDSGTEQPSEAQIRSMLERSMPVVYLVRGKDDGRLAWHYVLIYPARLESFKRQLVTGSLDVSDYGDVIESGWGGDPPANVTRAIERDYGM